ncbi:unnamed protein product, partial [Urochloa humidicola]
AAGGCGPHLRAARGGTVAGLVEDGAFVDGAWEEQRVKGVAFVDGVRLEAAVEVLLRRRRPRRRTWR